MARLLYLARRTVLVSMRRVFLGGRAVCLCFGPPTYIANALAIMLLTSLGLKTLTVTTKSTIPVIVTGKGVTSITLDQFVHLTVKRQSAVTGYP